MKTNQDYAQFFTGYLEALTDIDGGQREFGAYAKMFNSSNKNHILDIQKKFKYKQPIEVSNYNSDMSLFETANIQ